MRERTITRRMKNVFKDMEEVFGSLYTKEDFERALTRLELCRPSERGAVRALLEDMLKSMGIECERGKDTDYYKKLVKRAACDNLDAENKILKMLYDRLEEYLSPEDYMLKLVNKLDNTYKEDTLRLRILKRFIEYTDCLSATKYNGKMQIKKYVKEKTGMKNMPSDEEIVKNLDDGVFGLLDGASEERLRPRGMFGILKLCDDLAKGRFRTGGATKEGLYLFAVAFDMTYCTGAGNEIWDYDIEINLFRDYYSNNLMRFALESVDEKSSDFEREPSGQGINYKSFTEMIFLYYLSKDMHPKEKIEKIVNMTESVREGYAEENRVQLKDKRTKKYRDDIVSGIENGLFDLPEEEYEEFLKQNYNCSTREVRTKKDTGESIVQEVSPFQMELGQRTAFEEYCRIKELLPPKDEICYGLWFTDTKHLGEAEQFLYGDAKSQRLYRLLLSADRFLNRNKNGDVPALEIDKEEKMTRTALIVAFYYYYIHSHEENTERMSLKEVYESFVSEIDEILEKSFYQSLNMKNIFDVLVIFSAYVFVNMG